MTELFLMLDCETANTIDDPFYYDLGYAVVDAQGNIYETASFVNADIFLDEKMMATAYFKDKIPQYWEDIKAGKRLLKRHYNIRKAVREVMKKWGIKYVVAHNAAFDYRATNYTQRLLTSSKYRFFFPYGTQILDTLKMARTALKDSEAYKGFCKKNGFVCANGSPRYTAEVIYRWLTQDIAFEEKHTGLEDVLIEAKIFAFCRSVNPSVTGLLW